MTAITLTSDQQSAMDAIHRFIVDPIETVFVLSGYSGTGKSTLVKELLDRLPAFLKAAKLINPTQKHYEVVLTATTNKAAENFAEITGMLVGTIQSYLGLRVEKDYKTNTTKLVPSKKPIKEDSLIFIDEYSYMDSPLLQWVFILTKNCKIIFIGDPAQLRPPMARGSAVQDAKFTGATLTQVVRQAEGNPIIELSTKFRKTVETGEFFQFTPDGASIQYMERDVFNKSILSEFTRPDWKYKDSKVLAWTNKCVTAFNNGITSSVRGDPNFQVGDYAICNKFVSQGSKSIKTDQLVCITEIGPDTDEYGVPGNQITVNHSASFFFPKSFEKKNALIKEARAQGMFDIVARVEEEWIDLRAAYSQTVDKSQGSTYDRVFIDLDDISRCTCGNTMARMLYVGVSRARHQVFLTGDLV